MLKKLEFNIVFDNEKYDDNFKSLWGFSTYIKILPSKNILFDSGSNGRVLLENAKKMGLSLKDISTLFLSHPHWDHIGGLDTVIEENPNITIVVPKSFSKFLIDDLKTIVKEVIVVDKHPLQIENGIYSTGALSEIGEQSLIIDTDDGAILVVGCSHPGIVNIVQRAMKIVNKEIVFLIGGFHLLHLNDNEIELIAEKLKSLGVKYITPTHCTGKKAIEIFKRKFKDRYIKGGVGAKIVFD